MTDMHKDLITLAIAFTVLALGVWWIAQPDYPREVKCSPVTAQHAKLVHKLKIWRI